MYWYLIHTKPRQELCALQNLQRQGYTCYLPMLALEKLRRGKIFVCEEPLFPRYLFIALSTDLNSQSWAPIRSTRGVSRLVTFGSTPLKVPAAFIQSLQHEEDARKTEPNRLLKPGDVVQVTEGPFAGLQGIYQITDGEKRAIILLELLSKPTQLPIAHGALKRLD